MQRPRGVEIYHTFGDLQVVPYGNFTSGRLCCNLVPPPVLQPPGLIILWDQLHAFFFILSPSGSFILVDKHARGFSIFKTTVSISTVTATTTITVLTKTTIPTSIITYTTTITASVFIYITTFAASATSTIFIISKTTTTATLYPLPIYHLHHHLCHLLITSAYLHHHCRIHSESFL